MKPVYQTIFEGENSNCFQACVASILELEIDEVPNFMLHRGADWFEKAQSFCLNYGVYPVWLSFDDVNNKDLVTYGYHIIAVETERGRLHATVGYGGKIVHDPYPGGSVITKVIGYDLFISTMEKI